MVKPVNLDNEIHAALKMMSAVPTEERDMKKIIRDALLADHAFRKYFKDAREKLRVK